MVAIIRVHTSAPGMRTFQPSRISWSYRILGSEPRSQTNTNMKIETLARNQSSGHQPELAPDHTEIGHGAAQPPRNSVVARPDTVIIVPYSARENSANFSEEDSAG